MFQFQINHKDLEFGQMMRCLGPSTTGLFLTGDHLKRGEERLRMRDLRIDGVF